MDTCSTEADYAFVSLMNAMNGQKLLIMPVAAKVIHQIVFFFCIRIFVSALNTYNRGFSKYSSLVFSRYHIASRAFLAFTPSLCDCTATLYT